MLSLRLSVALDGSRFMASRRCFSSFRTIIGHSPLCFSQRALIPTSSNLSTAARHLLLAAASNHNFRRAFGASAAAATKRETPTPTVTPTMPPLFTPPQPQKPKPAASSSSPASSSSVPSSTSSSSSSSSSSSPPPPPLPTNSSNPSSNAPAKEPAYWAEDYEEEVEKSRDWPATIKSVGKSIWKGLKITGGYIINPPKVVSDIRGAWPWLKEAANHYILGTKLLAADIATASRLVIRMAFGNELTRRESRQLDRTLADLVRIVPFSLIVIIPFAEFALPFLLKLFPNMLPSTYEHKHERENKWKQELKTRINLAKTFQANVDDWVSQDRKAKLQEEAKELKHILDNVNQGRRVNTSDLIKVAKLFEDEITLDSLSGVQLQLMCKMLGLTTYGTDEMLRTSLRKRLTAIQQDDEQIQREGIASLTLDELKQACSDRGMRVTGLTEYGLRANLRQWIDLSLNKEVPSSLLLLSSLFNITEKRRLNPEQPTLSSASLRAAVEALQQQPDAVNEALETAGITDSNPKLKLAVVKRQNQLIAEESKLRSDDKEKKEEAKAKKAEAKKEEAKKEEAKEQTKEGSAAIASPVTPSAPAQNNLPKTTPVVPAASPATPAPAQSDLPKTTPVVPAAAPAIPAQSDLPKTTPVVPAAADSARSL